MGRIIRRACRRFVRAFLIVVFSPIDGNGLIFCQRQPTIRSFGESQPEWVPVGWLTGNLLASINNSLLRK